MPTPFTPALVLPEQLLGTRRDSRVCGERALMLAVLEDAIRCFQGDAHDARTRPGQLARRAEAWIRREDHRYVFSFVNVCQALDIDAGALRRALLGGKTRTGTNRAA